MTVWSVGWDILHGLDLGPTQHAIGNVLEDLVHLRSLGRSMEDRIKTVWSKCLEIYKDLQIDNRIPHLDLNTFRHADNFPRLRSKGNEARKFVAVIRRAVLELDPQQNAYSEHRLQMLDALLRFYKVVDSVELFLTDEEVSEGKRALSDFLLHYTWLSNDTMKRGLVRW